MERESFTEVILLLTRKKNQGSLLEYVRSMEPDHDFADILEDVVEERESIQLKDPLME
jgi:predicted CopG family antitoxin